MTPIERINGSLKDIFGTKGGKEMLDKLSSESPLRIILNNKKENFGEISGKVMTVD